MWNKANFGKKMFDASAVEWREKIGQRRRKSEVLVFLLGPPFEPSDQLVGERMFWFYSSPLPLALPRSRWKVQSKKLSLLNLLHLLV